MGQGNASAVPERSTWDHRAAVSVDRGKATLTMALLFHLRVTLKRIKFSHSCLSAEDVADELFLSGPGVLTCSKSCGAGGALPGPGGTCSPSSPAGVRLGQSPSPRQDPGRRSPPCGEPGLQTHAGSTALVVN